MVNFPFLVAISNLFTIKKIFILLNAQLISQTWHAGKDYWMCT